MSTRFFIILVLAASVVPAAAQQIGARAVALAGASTALCDPSGITANPASWASLDRPTVGLNAAQWYGLSELRMASAYAGSAIAGVSFVLGAQTFGFDLYRETRLALGLSRAFRPGTHRSMYAGVVLEETLIRIDGYGGAAFPSVSAGVLLPIGLSLTLGAVATNLFIVGRSAASESERSLALGVTYRHGSFVMVASDVLKEVRSPASIRFGVEVTPVASFALRVGVTTDPPRVTGGTGIRTTHLTIDAAAERHYALGWSPVMSVRVAW